MSTLALFAYGSLVSARSAAATLGRPVEAGVAARLHGFQRGWTLARDNLASEKTFALADGTLPRFCLGLDLIEAPGAPAPNGVLIELDEAELDRLDQREIRYRRIEVGDAVEVAGARAPGARVFAYRARPEHHQPAPPSGSIVISSYLETVEAAFQGLGDRELELFRETTAEIPAPVREAKLVRDRVPPGNPRAW